MSEDVVWRLLEWVDGPAAEHKDVVRDVLGRHPEIDGLTEEWLCVDVVCGRDGVSRKRFMVRTSPPPVSAAVEAQAPSVRSAAALPAGGGLAGP